MEGAKLNPEIRESIYEHKLSLHHHSYHTAAQNKKRKSRRLIKKLLSKPCLIRLNFSYL